MKLQLIMTLGILVMLVAGCSGGSGSPLAPQTPGSDIASGNDSIHLPAVSMTDGGNIPWGYWAGMIDVASRRIEVIRLREAEFHANLGGILITKPLGLSYEIEGFDPVNGVASVDVTLKHPYPNSNFRGFDTRGIFMGKGATMQSNNDPGLVYPAPNGCRVLNADGYTRWWNAQEFTTAGMYGYDDLHVIPWFLIPTTTLNPYKYFADCLGPDDDVVPNVNMTNRGTFSTDGEPPSLTRNYRIKLPNLGGQSQFGFHYAVDACWAAPDGNSPTPKPIEDFPIAANCREAFYIKVDTEGTTAWYISDTERGGEVKLAVEVFDWGAPSNPSGIKGEIESIWLESSTLFGAVYEGQLDDEPGSDETSGIFHFTIPDVTPSGLENQEILITVRSAAPNSYKPPVNGPAYPTAAVLSAYTLINVPINAQETHTIHVKKPNGYELLMTGTSPAIEWETSPYAEIEKVSILLSTNSGLEYDKPIALNVANTGSYIFYNLPLQYIGCHNRIKVLDADNPSLFDESDADFTILPQLEDQIILTAPNGGEEWIAGTYDDIEWIADPNIQNVIIKLSMDSGETWPVTIIDSTPNAAGKYNWGLIPQEYIGPNCRIAVHDAASPSIFDVNDMDFAIVEPGIEITAPVAGEIWEMGKQVEITYNASDIITNVDLLLSFDGGSTYPYTMVDGSSNTGSQLWIPDSPDVYETTQARIKIRDHNNPDLYFDESEIFTILERGITITYPNGGEGQELHIGFPLTIEWLWTGNIPLVDITMSLDGGLTFDNYIAQDETNNGSFDMAFFDFPWLVDYTTWDETTREAKIKIEASGDPALTDESDMTFTIPITLGILNSMNNATTDDIDSDGVKNEVEVFLDMSIAATDTDRDWMYDYSELFKDGGFGGYDILPDEDYDGIISPLDNDDDAFPGHDGELIDSDNDGIANYLEYYGYTYNWLTGKFLMWDEDGIDPDFTVDYFKTDPLQPSTDQDPYSDGMEVSGLFMDQSVIVPGDNPMVPASPNIVIRCVGYEVTLNADITDQSGYEETESTSWSRETSQTRSQTTEISMEMSFEQTIKASLTDFGSETSFGFSMGTSFSNTNTVGTTKTLSGTEQTSMNWSTATTSNPSQAAVVKLFLKAQNVGTACASNIIPTITVKVGRHQVVTGEPGNAQINLLPPGGTYPAGPNDYWVVDCIDTGTGVTAIYLTADELKAFECGVPISIVLAQMAADVAAMDEQGHWVYVGGWNEYMARVDAVCANLYIDGGDGNPINYMVYADDNPSAPKVSLRDAFIWAAGADDTTGPMVLDYKLADGSWTELYLEDCAFEIDQGTAQTIPGFPGAPPVDYNIMDLRLLPGTVITGKAPPLDSELLSTIHWAGWNPGNETAYAAATDYYSIESVEYFSNFSGSFIEMDYSELIGCYLLDMPDYDASDYIRVTNHPPPTDPPTSPTIRTAPVPMMAELPPGQVESYPVIGDARIGIRENQDGSLRMQIRADVEDEYYNIQSVSLMEFSGSKICDLSGPPEGGVWSVIINPADFNLTGTEEILAVNTDGYDESSAVKIYVPSGDYRARNYLWGYGANDDIPKWYDFESDSYSLIRNEYHDVIVIFYSSNSWLFWYHPAWAGEPSKTTWRRILNFPDPPKSFIAGLDDDGELSTDITWYRGSKWEDIYYFWDKSCIVFKTQEGRYGYMELYAPDPLLDPYYLYLRVYSSYEGPQFNGTVYWSF